MHFTNALGISSSNPVLTIKVSHPAPVWEPHAISHILAWCGSSSTFQGDSYKNPDKEGKYSCLYDESPREIMPAEGLIPADFSCIGDGGNGKMTCNTPRLKRYS